MAAKPNGAFIDELPSSTIPVDGVPNGGAGETGASTSAPATEPAADPDTINGFESFDPGTGTPSGGGTGSRRRGRPPGSRNAASGSKAAKSHISGLESLLLSVHMMGAAFLGADELMLSDPEAKMLADAAAKVADQYEHKMNPRMLAWANLAMVAGGIYGTRIFAIRARMKQESLANPKVTPIRPPRTVNTTPAPVPQAQPQTPSDMFGLSYSGAITDSL